MRNTRVAGHGLVSEGIPQWISPTCNAMDCLIRRTDPFHEGEDRIADRFAGGHARCSCGAESEHLPSQGARKRWHAAHKEEVAKW